MMEKNSENFWHAEDAAALALARNSTDLSRTDFSRALSISEKQLTQLEEGGSSAFYSERIKYQMGARILGYFDIQTVCQQASQRETSPFKVLSEPIKNEAINQLDTIYENKVKHLATADREAHQGFQLRNGYVLGAVIVAAAAFGIAKAPEVYFPFQNQTPSLAASAKKPVVPTPLPETQAQAQAPATPTEPEQAAPFNCDWSGNPTPLKPVSATRPADRIHLVAITDIDVCLKDGIGQEKIIKLQAGQRETFHGSGTTWQVYSPQMDYMQVFFQGFHVVIPKQTTQLIKLEPYF